MMPRTRGATGLFIAGPLLVLVGAWLLVLLGRDDRVLRPASEGDLWLDAGVDRSAAGALAVAATGTGIPPRWSHPVEAAVYPSSFPAPRFTWSDEVPDRLYHLSLSTEGGGRFDGVTRSLALQPPAAAWKRLVEQLGPSRRIEAVVKGAPTLGEGGSVGVSAMSSPLSLYVAAPEDAPSGMILFGHKFRPPHQPTGTFSLLDMSLRIDALDLSDFRRRVAFRSSKGPFRMAGVPGQPNGEVPSCVSCHTISASGKYVGVFSQRTEEAPTHFDAPNGFLSILRMPSLEIVAQLPHAFLAQFHPIDENRLVFADVDETIGVKDQMVVRRSDLKLLDLETGVILPVPGAAEPDVAENLPWWTPDGRRLIFSRTRPGEMLHGAAGQLDLYTVEVEGQGESTRAEPLVGAAHNGMSNAFPVVSPDGRWVVFTRTEKGFFSQESSDLWIVPAHGGESRMLGCNSPHTESWHRFSPDGKWLAFVSNREDVRRPHIYVSRFDSERGEASPPVQIPGLSGPEAHTHAFSWTPRFDWFEGLPTEDAGPAGDERSPARP